MRVECFYLHVHAYRMQARCPQRLEEGVESPGTQVVDSCMLSFGFQDPHPGTSGKQPVLSEPSLSSLLFKPDLI